MSGHKKAINTSLIYGKLLAFYLLVIFTVSMTVALENDATVADAAQQIHSKIARKVLPNEPPAEKPPKALDAPGPAPDNKPAAIEAKSSGVLPASQQQQSAGPSIKQEQIKTPTYTIAVEEKAPMAELKPAATEPKAAVVEPKVAAEPAKPAAVSHEAPSKAAEGGNAPSALPIETEVSYARNSESQPPSGFSDLEASSYTSTFLFFVGLSSVAVIFIMTRVYKLRLSRAERKYGVTSDRSTQELTPLPVAIEDGGSDDDDHTLFDISRQQIRIL